MICVADLNLIIYSIIDERFKFNEDGKSNDE
jgi:hypothetical protein